MVFTLFILYCIVCIILYTPVGSINVFVATYPLHYITILVYCRMLAFSHPHTRIFKTPRFFNFQTIPNFPIFTIYMIQRHAANKLGVNISEEAIRKMVRKLKKNEESNKVEDDQPKRKKEN